MKVSESGIGMSRMPDPNSQRDWDLLTDLYVRLHELRNLFGTYSGRHHCRNRCSASGGSGDSPTAPIHSRYTRSVNWTRIIPVILAISWAALAQTARPKWDGFYSLEQSARGKTLYAEQCAACH